jgi:hypothetical protein
MTDLSIIPFGSTERSIKDYKIRLKPYQSGIKLFIATSDTDNLKPIIPVPADLKLTFAIVVNNANYNLHYDCTHIPIRQNYACFTNKNAKTVGSQTVITSNGSLPYVTQSDFYKVYPFAFVYTTNHLSNPQSIAIYNSSGELITTSKYDEMLTGFPVNLKFAGCGLYTIKSASIILDTIYVSGSDSTPVFGIIDIYISPEQDSGRLLDGSGNIAKKKFVIGFNNRSTIWKYNVVMKYRLKDVSRDDWPSGWPSQWSIVYPPDSTVTFVPQISEITLNADNLYIVPFRSNKALPLKEGAIKGIRLLRTTGSGGGPHQIREVDNLPQPDPHRINGESIDCSEVNLYI